MKHGSLARDVLTLREIVRTLRVEPDKNVPAVRSLRRRWSRSLAGQPADGLVTLARRLIVLGDWERWVAYELLAHHPGALENLRSSDVVSLGRGMRSWGDVDAFGCLVSGPAWRKGRVPDSLVQHWAHSKDRWWRRAALVSTIPLNLRARGGSGDTRRTLMICRILATDRDDMVVKALSWALRVLSTQDAEAVRAFLRSHGSHLPARVIREVRNKLRTGLKNP